MMAISNCVYLFLLFVGVCIAVRLTVDDYPKCKPTEAARNVVEFCYRLVKGKKYDRAVVEDIPQKEYDDIQFCAYKRSGAVSADGSTFNVDKATLYLATVEADETTKTSLREGVKACGDKGGDGHAFINCTIEMGQTICK